MAYAHKYSNSTVGATFHAARVGANISQGQIAVALRMLGHPCSQHTISMFERGNMSETAENKWLPYLYQALTLAKSGNVKSDGHYMSPFRTTEESRTAKLIQYLKKGSWIDTADSTYQVVDKKRGHGRGNWTTLTLRNKETGKTEKHTARTLLAIHGKNLWFNFA